MSLAPRQQLAAVGATVALLAALAAAVGAAVGAQSLGLELAPYSPASASEAAAVFANNMRVVLLAGAAVACWELALPRVTLRCCDLALGLLAAINAIAIGAALGALGPAALGRVWPHAPLELGAFALVAAAYLGARRGRPLRRSLGLLALATVLLAAGAALEIFISGELR